MLIVLACIVVLILLITYGRLNAFLAFLIVSTAGGLMLGIEPGKIGPVLQKGIGDMIGSLAIVVIAGSMLGKLVADTGAAQQIAGGLMRSFGQSKLQLAFLITGFVIGLPLFYNVAFILVFPLIASVVYRYKLPAVFVGLPMVASLSVTHGFLPPHPSPVALVAQFGADTGLTLLYGIAIAIPTVVLAGPVFSRTLKNLKAEPIRTFQVKEMSEDQLPGLANSVVTAVMPVLLLATTTILSGVIAKEHPLKPIVEFFSDSAVVMLFSLLYGTYSLGLRRGMKMKEVMGIYEGAVRDVAMIVLIMGGAGGLKQILQESGVSSEIASLLSSTEMNPLILGWLIACLIRVSVGSATVAGLTAAGIVAPLVVGQQGVSPELMVLSVGAGSLMFSHVNDAGFWLFKEYFNLSIKETIRSWSLMETIVAVCGLLGVLSLQLILN
ncbi:MAG: gluconate transporter [Bacteroidetes bacterium]|nr:gluconate transporter [Bacteroidota bacterium]